MGQPTVEQLVAAGAAALRAGERERARQLLGDAVRADPRSPQAWLFLAGAVTDDGQRRQCLERVLALSPGHPAALRGLDSLARKAAAAAPTAPGAPPAPPAQPTAPGAPPAPTAQPTAPAPAQSRQPPPDVALPAASPARTRQLPPAVSPPAVETRLMPPEATPAHVVNPAPVAGGPLLGRLAPSAVTRTTSVAPDPDAPSQPAGPSTGDTTPLLTLPVEAPAAPPPADRRLWLAVLAAGALLMLLGLVLLVVALL